MEPDLRRRLIVINVSLLLVIVLVGATALFALHASTHSTERTQEIDRRLAQLDHIRAATRAIATSARRYVLGGDLQEQQRVFAIVNDLEAIRRSLDARTTLPKGPELEADLDAYIASIVNAMSRDDADPIARLSMYEDELERSRNPLMVTYDAVVSYERSRRSTLREANTLAKRAQWAVLVASVLGSILAIAATLKLRRTQVGKLVDAALIHAATAGLRRERLDAAMLVDRAIKRARDAAAERSVRLHYEAQLATTVFADRERILHVLDSLLQVAIAQARPGAELVTHVGAAQGGVRFAIIEATPAEAAISGHELSLELCQRVVEAHGGRMGIQSSAISRTYWFTLPTEPSVLM